MEAQPITAFDEVYNFLTSRPTEDAIAAFRPSEATQARVRYLLDANRAGTLTPQESAELDEYGKIEHFMRMLKIKAYQKLAAT